MEKKGIVWSEIVWWIVGLVLLAIVIIILVFMKTADFNLIDEIKEILKFGR